MWPILEGPRGILFSSRGPCGHVHRWFADEAQMKGGAVEDEDEIVMEHTQSSELIQMADRNGAQCPLASYMVSGEPC